MMKNVLTKLLVIAFQFLLAAASDIYADQSFWEVFGALLVIQIYLDQD
jgi:hypothetical protein